MTEGHTDAGKHVKLYLMVLAALVVGTVATVLVAQKDLGGHANVIVALLIAAAKASLVAMVFMHLKWEGSGWIWWPLAICALFLLVILLLPFFTMSDYPPGVQMGSWG